MKIMIAVPCMDQCPTPFVKALASLRKIGDCTLVMQSGSLVYTSRNDISQLAIREEYDYVLWLEIVKKVGTVYGNQEVIASYRILSTQLTAKKSKMIKPQYKVYREIEHLGPFKSLYYLICWGIRGIIKYRK